MNTRVRYEVWALTLLAALTASGAAMADIKNQGGLVCKRLASSPAPESAVYTTFEGQTCNNSTQQLQLTCPVVQDLGTNENATFTFDYEMWNLNGLNGNQDTYPEQSLKCAAFSRTRYAKGYYWSGWKEAADYNGYGDTPTGMTGSVAMLDNSFIHGICYVPSKYNNKMSCISHIQYNEQ